MFVTHWLTSSSLVVVCYLCVVSALCVVCCLSLVVTVRCCSLFARALLVCCEWFVVQC